MVGLFNSGKRRGYSEWDRSGSITARTNFADDGIDSVAR